MSLTFRLLVGIPAAVFGLLMCAIALSEEKAVYYYLFGIFCFAVACACFVKGRAAHFAGGVIASSVLAAGLGYLYFALFNGPLYTGRSSETSLVNALLFNGFFCYPAARYLWKTRFGFGQLPKPLNELLTVEFDDAEVRVRVLEQLDPAFNQSFLWADVERVCFKDEGVEDSDILFIEVRGRTQPVAIFTEAKGGSELFGALTDKGLFPEEVWRKAMGEVGGSMHCWPPRETASGA